MQTSANILLLIAVLAAAYLFKLNFLQKAPGGDYGVGYAWVTLFAFLVFWVCITLVAGILIKTGAFDGLPLGRFGGSGRLILCFVVLLLGSTLGITGIFRMVPFLTNLNALATPLVLLLTFVVLSNDNLKTMVSPTIIKWSLATVLALNSLVLLSPIFGNFTARLAGVVHRAGGQLDEFQLGILAQIDSTDVNKGISSLFLYSGNNQPREIREKARLKIKSKPDWQDELYKALEGDGVEEAFRFLNHNEVDDKARFAKGVYQGLLNQARLIRENLRSCTHPSNVYDGMFGSEIRRSLEVAEKFKGLGVDYKPAVQEMRAALDERQGYGDPNHSDKKLLDKWLAKH
jgi:hypothetical protein